MWSADVPPRTSIHSPRDPEAALGAPLRYAPAVQSRRIVTMVFIDLDVLRDSSPDTRQVKGPVLRTGPAGRPALLAASPGASRTRPSMRRSRFAVVRQDPPLAGPPVPDHVSSVLRVEQDLPDREAGPVVLPPGGVGRRGWWIALEVSVQPLRDLRVPQPLPHAPREDLPHSLRADGIRNEAALGLPLRASGRDGVRDLLGDVAVRRLAHVPALAGVLAEPVPGLLQHLQDVPLGNALLDPAG